MSKLREKSPSLYSTNLVDLPMLLPYEMGYIPVALLLGPERVANPKAEDIEKNAAK
ncbi:hypothetical protein OQJ62_13790 [Microbulbifer thermotolerans]|uniref:hypothetical protein n=1 Tax=Microbulbifer thermotolerans TaxID=252514 RepID=UPI0022492EBC|nr:hypothetical protein [Microbulbifer thermotolerans]MCX2795993.1 hypothetical protein [Microbulbifer thermotolerans]